jgi:hypothetical protein
MNAAIKILGFLAPQYDASKYLSIVLATHCKRKGDENPKVRST